MFYEHYILGAWQNHVSHGGFVLFVVVIYHSIIYVMILIIHRLDHKSGAVGLGQRQPCAGAGTTNDGRCPRNPLEGQTARGAGGMRKGIIQNAEKSPVLMTRL